MATATTAQHDVVRDGAGWMQHRERFTCRTPGCDGATLLRQPYMDDEMWEQKKAEYFTAHPCKDVKTIP